MFRRSLPILVVALTAVLSWAAIEYMPATMYFPVVRYSVGGVDVAILKRGELDAQQCERNARQVGDAVRAACPACSYQQQCVSGIDDYHRDALSPAPFVTPSLRSADGTVTMTVAATDNNIAMSVCKAIEAQSQGAGPAKPLRCFPAGTARS